jgi:hypothetical protein
MVSVRTWCLGWNIRLRRQNADPRRLSHYLSPRPNDRELSIEQRLEGLGFSPEYFVITDFWEYDSNHDDLKYLAGSCTLVAESDEYLIYGACAQK